jgi:predicted Abi (CAAX) family protease
MVRYFFGYAIFIALSCKPQVSQDSSEEAASQAGRGGFISTRDYFDAKSQGWTGRLILPELKDRKDGAVLFEVYHGEKGQTYPSPIWLTWNKSNQDLVDLVNRTTKDVTISPADLAKMTQGGNRVSERFNNWKKVSFLETLAGGRADAGNQNDVIKGQLTTDSVEVFIPKATKNGDTLVIDSEPVQIIGTHVGLFQFIRKVENKIYAVKQWDGKKFSGSINIQYENPVGDLKRYPAIPELDGIETSPLNQEGWYAYGDLINGKFTVRALEPRSVMKMTQVENFPDGIAYIEKENFRDMRAKKGKASTAMISKNKEFSPPVGIKGIGMHIFGGIEGHKGDFTRVPGLNKDFYTGHMSFGVAQVVRDPFTGEKKMDFEYRQVYATNPNAIIAGAHKWHSYAGSLRRGWMYGRPISDTVIWHPSLMYPYKMKGRIFDPTEELVHELDVMGARFRSGDGKGIAEVTIDSSCSQDSMQAIYIALARLSEWSKSAEAKEYRTANAGSENLIRFDRLLSIGEEFQAKIIGPAQHRPDWKAAAEEPFISSRSAPSGLEGFVRGLLGYRFIAPEWAYVHTAKFFYERGAQMWFIRTNQIASPKPGIYPTGAGF